MAPSPVLNIEPKGPDKTGEKCPESVSTNDKQNKSKTVDDNAASKDKISVDQLSFAEIEEAGLKSLLDEAYSYKSPKDRLGKSDLFQVLLNEVEENDASKKKLSERSNSFADGRGNASASIGNGHDTANDKTFLNNILGGCEKDKKKKKSKRESLGTNGGSRRPKFSHSMKVNTGPQSSSAHLYNGNNTSNNSSNNSSNNTSSSNSSSNNNNNNTSSSTTGSSNISSSSSNNNTNSNSNISSSSSSSCSSANGVHYNGSSRSLSRTHQSFASRINNSKTAALLTSSSNIDIPMVTTYNKQPIMTPALLPSSQKSAELLMLDLREQNSTCSAKSDDATVSPKSSTLASGAETENDIEMKILDTKNGNSNSANNNNNDSVYNYTTHASLEIGAGNTDACKQFDDCSEDNDNAAAVIFPLQSSGSAAATAAATLLNGNAERSSMQRGNSQKPVNGLSADEKEEIDHVICNNNNNSENDEDKHSKKKNKKKQAPCLENDNDNSNGTSIYATSIDEPKTMTSLLQKSAQNSSTNNSAYKYPTEPYSFTPWHVPAPNLIVTLSSESMANLGRNICTKDSLDSRRLYDENSVLNSNYPYLSSNSASMNRDRVDNVSERKHKIRKPKKQNTTSVLSENIEGYCGDKSVEYLVDYIENTKAGGGGGSCNGGGNGTGGAFGELGNSSTSKSVKSKSVSSSSSRNCDRSGKNGGKAATDDDVRSNKKPSRAKDRLKKSTSLEDLRHSSSKTKQQQNKKQSSVDDSHYIGKESSLIETESISPVVVPPAPVSNSTPIDSQTSSSDDTISHQQPPNHHRELENLQLLQEHQHQHQQQQQQQQNVDQQLEHSHNLYYDNLDHVDDDNYTETEFHLVTKKQRKKKRRSKSRSSTLEHQKHHNHLHHHSSSHHSHQHHGIHDASATASASSSSLSHNFLPHHYTDKNDNGNFAAYQNSKRSTRSSENRHRSRRKSVSSVVPSDKISDSDSIHSLPVSSTTPKCKIKKKSTSSGCTPQASYADIAKSPQCNSSTTLNGGDAKWHRSLKPFSNSPSSSLSSSSSAYSTQNTCGSVTTASSFGSSSASSSSNTGGDSPEHSDNSELTCATAVPPSSSVVVGVDNDNDNDRSCDLNCSNLSSPAFNDSAATIVDAASSTNLLIDDKDSGCSSSVNDSGANESTVDVATSTPPRHKNKSSTRTKNTNDNNDTNNNATNVVVVACCNGNGNGDCDGGSDAIDTTKMPKDYPNNISNSNASNNNVNHSSSNSNNNNNNNNTNNTKVKKTRNKKNKNANGGGGVNVNVHGSSAVEGGGGNVDENDIANDNHDTAAKTSTSNDLFVEFTLKCAANASATITTTKCSETQTDLETVEVNNNACTRYHHHHHLNHHNLSNSNGCNDVSVEKTIVLKSSCSKSNDGTVSSDGSQSMSYVDKLSHSLPIHDETGRASVTHVLNDRRCPNSGAPDEINVAFNVDDNVLSMGADDAEAVEISKQRQLEIQKEIIERSSKYNVTEVIQYVNKSWNEVMNLASSKVTNINKKVQYYASK